MTSQSSTTVAVWVAIDVAKLSHQVLLSCREDSGAACALPIQAEVSRLVTYLRGFKRPCRSRLSQRAIITVRLCMRGTGRVHLSRSRRWPSRATPCSSGQERPKDAQVISPLTAGGPAVSDPVTATTAGSKTYQQVEGPGACVAPRLESGASSTRCGLVTPSPGTVSPTPPIAQPALVEAGGAGAAESRQSALAATSDDTAHRGLPVAKHRRSGCACSRHSAAVARKRNSGSRSSNGDELVSAPGIGRSRDDHLGDSGLLPVGVSLGRRLRAGESLRRSGATPPSRSGGRRVGRIAISANRPACAPSAERDLGRPTPRRRAQAAQSHGSHAASRKRRDRGRIAKSLTRR